MTREQVEEWFARADEMENVGARPRRVALALFNPAFPLPLDAATTLRACGFDVVDLGASLRADAATSTIADAIAASGAQVALVSHPRADAARELAARMAIPVLNAGDPVDENPVRALLDAYAIRVRRGHPSGLRVALLGNLKFSAEAHSLARVLGLFGGRLSFVSPAALSMPYDLTDEVRLTAYEVEETNDLPTTLRKTDVLVLIELDPVRVEKKHYDKLRGFYTLSPASLSDARPDLLVMGEWEGADEILAPAREEVTRARARMLCALVEASA